MEEGSEGKKIGTEEGREGKKIGTEEGSVEKKIGTEEGSVGKKIEKSTSSSSHGPDSGPQGLTRRSSRSAATTTFSTEVFDNEVAPSSLQQISPILRVATEIENDCPRVAFPSSTP